MRPFPGRAPLALLLAASLTGCYSYLPASRQTLAPSAEVRVRPSLEFRAGLRSVLGTEPTSLEGTVLEVADSALTLEVVTAGIEYGARARPLTQRVIVPWGDLLEMQEKRLDRQRTGAVIAAAGAAAVAAFYFAFRGEFGGTTDGGPIDGDGARLPVPLPIPIP